jgi:FAD-linked sulfhydryl oxidase
MTREELGRHGWTLLHMISATLPIEFDANFSTKINVFLNLFGQFYPCKECANHFLAMLTEYPYNGRTREDFMQYLCKLHNFVNRRLNHVVFKFCIIKKPIFECKDVHAKWGGYCGCEEAFNNSVEKYKEKDNN